MVTHFNRGRPFQIRTLCFIKISDHSVCNVPVVEPRKIIMNIQRREKEFKVICKIQARQSRKILGRSLKKMRNKNGPSTEPCGTPLVTKIGSEK